MRLDHITVLDSGIQLLRKLRQTIDKGQLLPEACM